MAILCTISIVPVWCEFIKSINQAIGRVAVVVTPAKPLAGFNATDATRATIVEGGGLIRGPGRFYLT